MTRLPWQRIAAWLVDCALILLCAGLLALFCVPLYRAGVLGDLPLALANVVATLVLVLPAVLVLALLEAGPWTATIGKRLLGLRLADADGGRVTYPRALMRNTVKVGLPWIIAHAAVYGIWDGSAQGTVPGWVWPPLAAAYAIPIVWVASLFIRTGRTPYDLLARTSVVMVGRRRVRDLVGP